MFTFQPISFCVCEWFYYISSLSSSANDVRFERTWEGDEKSDRGKKVLDDLRQARSQDDVIKTNRGVIEVETSSWRQIS